MIQELINLVYTKTCPACKAVLLNNEDFICTSCLYHLPGTNYTDMRNNPVARLFWGRVRLEYATSLYHYSRGSKLQNIMHKLKYRGNRQLGTELGILLGKKLKGTCFSGIDIIVPVPLHKKKQGERGYNQSELIAEGFCRVFGKPLNVTSCERLNKTGTQTHKSRYERWYNVNGVFRILENETFIGKHILLIDDVVTTGATLEALAAEFLRIRKAKVSIATIAVADLLI